MMTRIHVAFALASIALFGGVLLPGTTKAGEPVESSSLPPLDFENYVVWDQRDPTRVRFIPQAQLQEDRRLDYPLDEVLESSIIRTKPSNLTLGEFTAQAFSYPSEHCAISSGGATSHHVFENAPSLVEFVKERNFLARGNVLAVVPGWLHRNVATMIYVQVDDILWCRLNENTRVVEVSDIVSIAVKKGVIQVDGRYFCNGTDSGLEIPEVGAEVIILGYPFQGHSHYMGLGTVHLVRDGMIEPQPYERTRHRQPTALSDLEASLAPDTGRCAP